MNTDWQTRNTQFLAAALAWLRLRLRLAAPSTLASTALPPSPAPKPKPRSWADGFFQRAPAPVVEALPVSEAPPAVVDAITAEQVAQAAQAMEDAAKACQPPPALWLLGERLELSRFERDILLLCAALELDPQTAALCANAQANPHQPYPTFALALVLFDEPTWDALSPHRPLRYWRLVEIHQPGAQPLTTSALRADERIVSYLKGLNQPDDRLTNLLLPASAFDQDLPPSQQAAAEAILRQWEHNAQPLLPVAQLLGPDAASKQLVASAVVQALGQRLYVLPAEALPTQAAELETLTRLWQRESLLLPLALYVDAQAGEHLGAVGQFLARAEGLLFVGLRESWPDLRRAHFAVEVAKPTPAEQCAAWAAALDAAVETTSEVPGQLAAQFNLNLPTIAQVSSAALAAPETKPLAHRLWQGCCAVAQAQLDTLAQRIDPKATWRDLVLPKEQRTLLQQLAAQASQRHRVYETWGFGQKMNRGLGLTALFAGESGTGKTMAAEVIANHLCLNLYRIDLSAVVSKYIGETEKNLRRVFDAADDGSAILFFDEADALFGKRSEVKDSHDRYANIEINYLLQRMEAYRGLAILATNLKNALDPAFVRRLRFMVNFPFPGVAERKRLWRKAFPAQLPREPLNYDRLARFNLTGGNIHSIALNAAFLAARKNRPVTMPIVLAAARTEFRKLEKPISEADFKV